MVAAAKPAEPLMGEVACPRLRAGVAVTETLWVSYDPPFGPVAAVLWINSEWDGSVHKVSDRYTVIGVQWVGPVCDVTLKRDPEKVLHADLGGDRNPFYVVSVIGDGGWCTCRGFQSQRDEPKRPCKHISACAFVRAAGLFSNSERLVQDEQREPEAGGGRAAGPQQVGDGRQED